MDLGIIEAKQVIIGLVAEAAKRLQLSGEIPSISLPGVTLDYPPRPGLGDYATNFPLKLAHLVRRNPLEIAGSIISALPPSPELDHVDVAPPGFINFTLSDDWLRQKVTPILESGDRFGNIAVGGNKRVQIEFVSVNPTGPLHVGHGRGAVLGSTLAAVLEAAGYSVEKEYYINDAGSQVQNFARSVFARYCEVLGINTELPPDAYLGNYVWDIAKEIAAEQSDHLLQIPVSEAIAKIETLAVRKILDSIQDDLQKIGVSFDAWFRESTLYTQGTFSKVMQILRDKGYLAEKEGAIWFTSSLLGEDKDNVIIRRSNTPTYFASDIAYHYNKFVERGFDEVIDIWGADHQGHVARMKAVVTALGLDPDKLRIIITQMVTLRRGDEIVKVSKRSGDFITLREVIDEVGPDACRFFFLCRAPESQMDFDLEEARKQSIENPVYYIQYAHTRIASILRLGRERGIDYSDGDVSLLTSGAEMSLIRKMLQLPEVVEEVVHTFSPHYLTYYSQDLAAAFHCFYRDCRVISSHPEDLPLSKARLKLVAAARIVFARTLSLMGVAAPEKM